MPWWTGLRSGKEVGRWKANSSYLGCSSGWVGGQRSQVAKGEVCLQGESGLLFGMNQETSWVGERQKLKGPKNLP